MQPLSLLRKNIRKQRKNLNQFQQRQAEIACLHQIIRNPLFHHAQHIGLYLDAFGEIQTRLLLLYCFQKRKNVYLPKVCAMNQCLNWVKVSKKQYLNNRFSKHQLGMYEPQNGIGIQTQYLDVIFMPLLACDLLGTRLGMGGGFYDRTLAHTPKKPYRIGLAHDFQVIKTPLLRRSWDQPLDALFTPSKHYQFTSNLR
ncbi:5-formyltetrahydrofolate cyclo-ligase [Acinetobacter nectaris]|uniref:5-formyltetrahydrofolate cyclo-ligase n=1 Tax=Acinetobacter nectaris TaxID=1219382 RepID=UPI001EFFC6FB|nr:5-formyltetrahydrofolate cyclo-ligase [Acinetobacter nectaris]MCF9045799.1 5-formyltetrahydrofolate cyclo-ligase [Acinetobacter nectaris]